MLRRTVESAVLPATYLAGLPISGRYLGPLVAGCFGFLAAMLIALFF
jgi:hypothetical protein